MDILRKHLLREGHLNKPELMEVVQKAVEIMSKWLFILQAKHFLLMRIIENTKIN